MKSPKRFTLRKRHDGEWIALYAEQYEPGIWNLGCCIHKSKRAQNDWYWRKKNKKSKAVKNNPKKRSVKTVRMLYELFETALTKIKNAEAIIVCTTTIKKYKVIDRYLKNLNAYTEKTEVGWFWVFLPAKN
jgi:hypothetical protein